MNPHLLVCPKSTYVVTRGSDGNVLKVHGKYLACETPLPLADAVKKHGATADRHLVTDVSTHPKVVTLGNGKHYFVDRHGAITGQVVLFDAERRMSVLQEISFPNKKQ